MATFGSLKMALEKSARSSQTGKTWAGKRVKRAGIVYEVISEDRKGDKLVARDVAENRKRTWKRSAFLSRGLTITKL